MEWYEQACEIGPRLAANGYARLRDDTYAHRAAWEEVNGPIPEGHHIHHLCNNPGCVNVEHLECVTPIEHARRHAPSEPRCGHGDFYVRPDGGMECRECRREQRRRRWASDPEYRAKRVAYTRERRRETRV
jgi:hypothetical protein